MERKRLTENLRDYYESEILGKSIILRDLLNIEFPLNALTNELGEYLGYDEEDFTKEELGSRVIVTDIYTDADSFIGAEIKFENRDLIENKRLNKDRLELIWEVNPNDIYQQLDIRDIQKAKRNRRMGGEDETGSGGFWDLAFEETLNYLFHEVGLTDLTNAEHRAYTLLAEDVYNVLVDNEENYVIVRKPTLYENKTLTEAAINFTYSDYDLPTYVFNATTSGYEVDEDSGEYSDDYYYDETMYFREAKRMIKSANEKLKEQQSLLVSELNNEEAANIVYEIGYEADNDDYNRDTLEYAELLELVVWPGYYDGFSIGFNYVDPDIIRMRTEGSPAAKNFANSLIGAAEDLLAEIADETFMRKARSGGWAGPVYLDEAKSKLNKNKGKKLNKNKTLTEALDYNEEFDEVIFELYYERIEDGTDIKELEDARKLLKTYNLNFKEEVKRGWPVFVIQDNLDKVVDFIADYMGYYGEELIEMLQDSVEPVGGGEIPEEELFILVTLKGLL